MSTAAFAARRAAERRQLVAKIEHTPTAARYRSKSLNILFHDPAKAREMKSAGFGSGWAGNAYLALPLTDRTPPESEKDTIDVRDFSGETCAYIIATVTPLVADNCYLLTLRARNARPARGASAISP